MAQEKYFHHVIYGRCVFLWFDFYDREICRGFSWSHGNHLSLREDLHLASREEGEQKIDFQGLVCLLHPLGLSCFLLVLLLICVIFLLKWTGFSHFLISFLLYRFLIVCAHQKLVDIISSISEYLGESGWTKLGSCAHVTVVAGDKMALYNHGYKGLYIWMRGTVVSDA